MDIAANDCRLDGFHDALGSYWLRATHFPTGVTVETRQSPGVEGKRRLMEKLQAAVRKHMNAESVGAAESEVVFPSYFSLVTSETRGSLFSFHEARGRLLAESAP